LPLLPLGDLDDVSDELKQALKGRLPVNLYRVMTHSPAALGAFLAFASKMSRHEIGKPLRELIILRVAALRGATYVGHQHHHLALALGYEKEKIAAIEAGNRQSVYLDETEQALLRFTDEIVLQTRASADAVHALAKFFSPHQLVDAAMIAGQYLMVSTFVQTFQVPIELEGEISLEDYSARAYWQPTVGI
jgi:4-carboxymuconolactone decarboxylase